MSTNPCGACFHCRRGREEKCEAPTLSKREREILEHALGWRSSNPGYRNHYCTSPGTDDFAPLQALVARGLMVDHGADSFNGGLHTFTVTAAGRQALGEP